MRHISKPSTKIVLFMSPLKLSYNILYLLPSTPVNLGNRRSRPGRPHDPAHGRETSSGNDTTDHTSTIFHIQTCPPSQSSLPVLPHSPPSLFSLQVLPLTTPSPRPASPPSCTTRRSAPSSSRSSARRVAGRWHRPLHGLARQRGEALLWARRGTVWQRELKQKMKMRTAKL